MAADNDSPLFFIVAGEPSGDLIGARIMESLRAATGGKARFAGIGGENMAALDLQSLVPLRDLAVMGFFEVLPRIPRILGHLKRCIAEIERLRPAAIITIDSWGFTGCLAKGLIERESKIPRIHVVAPMVWAWKEKRAKSLAERLDLLLVLLPNEPPYFERHGLKTIHIGHPVLEGGADKGDGPAFRARHSIPPEVPLLAVLPGSRRSETSRLLPIFGEAVAILVKRFPNLRVVVPTVDTVAEDVTAAVAAWSIKTLVVRGAKEKFDAFAAADAALAASGTVAVELAMAGTPHLVAYRVHPFTAALARRLLKIRYVNLVNILLEREATPELLQENCQADLLAQTMTGLLADEAIRKNQRAAFGEALARLGQGGPGPGERAAVAILSLIKEKSA
jgi:lipid-A-disaccharide synthase